MNRRYIITAIVAAVAVVAALVGVSLAGGDSDEVTAIEGAAEVTGRLEGVPQEGNVLGRPSAPVTVVEYGDIACPVCKIASEDLIPMLVTDYVRTGRAKLEFRPIAFISPSSERGAFGSEAAANQDMMWTLVELLYRNQGPEQDDWLTDDLLAEAAEEAGLDMERWRADYAGDAVVTRLNERERAANEDGVTGTPTFVVSGPGGEETVSADGVVAAIEKVGPSP